MDADVSDKGSPSSTGIFVSRVVAGSAADQPGKLKLHDQIVQVDGVDLRNATHELAVETFRKSADPVKIVVQRHTSKTVVAPTTRDAMTQIGGRMFAVTGPGEALDDMQAKNKIPDLLYDSGFDTLLTHKSSRSSGASTFTESSDGDNISRSVAESVSSELSSNEVSPLSETTAKRCLPTRSGKTPHGTYRNPARDVTEPILPQLSKVWIDDESVDEQEMEFEYEYEEVLLAKLDGAFGLLLCYGGDEGDVSVYIGDVEENSAADMSGQILVGDQIVKINECLVRDVDEAYRMLRESENIKLVVARPVYDALWRNYDDAAETDLDLDYLESIKEEPLSSVEETQSRFSAGTGSVRSAASLGRSCSSPPTSSPVNSSKLTERIISAPEVAVSTTTLHDCSISSRDKADLSRSPRVSAGNNITCRTTDVGLKPSVQTKQSVVTENGRSKRRCDFSGAQDGVDCRRSDSTSKSGASSTGRVHLYNESARVLDDHKCIGAMSKASQTAAPRASSLRSALKNDHRGPRDDRTEKQKHVLIDPHPGWNNTERKVWEEFKLIQRLEAEEKEQGNTDIEASWRVRRSKDGNHVYIKKTNMNRANLLKERAQQVREERSGITTDDDAFTVYQGRYWNRDDRRRQLIRHQEKKRRLLQKMNEKALVDHSAERSMAETVQRNMTLPGRGFDDFLTVADILAQRNRAGIFYGPIHVTTI